jgi:hypothetical protein
MIEGKGEKKKRDLSFCFLSFFPLAMECLLSLEGIRNVCVPSLRVGQLRDDRRERRKKKERSVFCCFLSSCDGMPALSGKGYGMYVTLVWKVSITCVKNQFACKIKASVGCHLTCLTAVVDLV